jgi:hypothetical protein
VIDMIGTLIWLYSATISELFSSAKGHMSYRTAARQQARSGFLGALALF